MLHPVRQLLTGLAALSLVLACTNHSLADMLDLTTSESPGARYGDPLRHVQNSETKPGYNLGAPPAQCDDTPDHKADCLTLDDAPEVKINDTLYCLKLDGKHDHGDCENLLSLDKCSPHGDHSSQWGDAEKEDKDSSCSHSCTCVTPTPEPTSLVLFGMGMAGFGITCYRRRYGAAV